MNTKTDESSGTAGRAERNVRPLAPKRSGLSVQIDECRREVSQWPEWMRATRTAPKWMEGWDD